MAQGKDYLRDEFHSWWHKFEMGAFRTTVVAVGVIALLSVVIVVLLMVNARKDRMIEYLAENQTMIGFQQEDGSFVSATRIPEYFVVRYARSFVNNLSVYGPTGVADNMNEARRMMDPQLAIDTHDRVQEIINEARRDYITQNYEIDGYLFSETQEGWVVKFKGVMTRFAGQTQYGPPKEKIITVRLKRVPITESTKEGMVVVGVNDKLPFDKPVTTAAGVGQTAAPTGAATQGASRLRQGP